MRYKKWKEDQLCSLLIFRLVSDKAFSGCSWEDPNSNSDGVQVLGTSWPTKNIESVDDCARLCTKTKDCNGFHYYGKDDKAEKDCYIKQGVTKVIKNVGDTRIRYGGICKPPGIRTWVSI